MDFKNRPIQSVDQTVVDYNSDPEDRKIPVPKQTLKDKIRSHYQVYPSEMIESYLNEEEETPKLLDPEEIQRKQEERKMESSSEKFSMSESPDKQKN